MRILLVNKFHYRKGGAETYYLTVGSELERIGHEVAYFSMRHPDNLPCEWDKYFVTQREYNNVKNPFKAKRNFQALCEEFRPDVVHLNNVHRQITLSILDAPYLREKKTPVFYTAHDYVTVCPGYLMLDGHGRVCDACLEDGHFRHCFERRCVKGSRAKSALAAMEASFNRADPRPRRECRCGYDRQGEPLLPVLRTAHCREGRRYTAEGLRCRLAEPSAEYALSCSRRRPRCRRSQDARVFVGLRISHRVRRLSDRWGAASVCGEGVPRHRKFEMAREYAVLDCGGSCCRHACHRHEHWRNP